MGSANGGIAGIEIEALLSGENGAYVEALFEDYVTGAAVVPLEWRERFDALLGRGAPARTRPVPAPGGNGNGSVAQPLATPAEVALPSPRESRGEATGIFGLVNAYRSHGHLLAHLDPLEPPPQSHPILDPREFGIRESQMDVAGPCGNYLGLRNGTPRELIESLRRTYCRTLAVEFMEIRDKERRDWLIEAMEPCENRPVETPETRTRVLKEILQAERFEQFLHKKFIGQKRFSIEGGDALIPLLDEIVEEGAALGLEELVIAMAHRGRLNVLAHTMGMPHAALMAEFHKTLVPVGATGSGDVKYHRGYSADRTTRLGHAIHLSLCFNPSHLEAVNPVCEGMTRAKQNLRGDVDRVRVAPIQIHGDAAFNGQGVVAETLALSELESFWTGGTIHIIVNNKIGFTTDPHDYSFTQYPSDMAKVIQAPVFHVNADDPEACIHAARLAVRFRQTFHEDVIIDLVCYRRYGHNEGDDPSFTQPLMYKKIAAHDPIGRLYTDRLLKENAVSRETVEGIEAKIQATLDRAMDESQGEAPLPLTGAQPYHGRWAGLGGAWTDAPAPTGIEPAVVERVASAILAIPPDFNMHRKVQRQMETRVEMLRSGGPIDWGAAEALALGSLMLEGTTVRVTGQDAERATFGHRHAVYHDVETGRRFVPLAELGAPRATFIIANSPLSEASVLGFEYGYSTVDPHRLVIWEAQYGDFANGAQIIIDQFISSGEQKWGRSSGVVMLLPHGYEGQGPEHSSARLERFLQLCAEDNMQVVNLTTPAQIFHALRRQIHRPLRKPLVVMSPKSLLRNPRAVSPIEDILRGSFQEVIDDPARAAGELDPKGVRRVLLCAGKLYYALLDARAEHAFDDVALVRIEQLHPFPFQKLQSVLEGYDTRDFMWVQEEPWNMGSWTFVSERLRQILPKGSKLRYAGRPESAATATGSYRKHEQQESEFMEVAFSRTTRVRKTAG